MAVWAIRHGQVHMFVMAIVVDMSVLMLQCVVKMLVHVRLGDMQHHADNHACASNDEQSAHGMVSHRQGNDRPNEGSKRKYRACACSAERPLRE